MRTPWAWRVMFGFATTAFLAAIAAGVCDSYTRDGSLPDLLISETADIPLLLKQKDYEQAIQQLQLLLQIQHPAMIQDAAGTHALLGRLLLRQGKIDQAIEPLLQAIELNPGAAGIRKDAAETHARSGELLLREGKIDQAIEQLLRAIELNPRAPEVHNHLGVAWLQQNKLDLAVAHMKQALKINPNHAPAHNALGTVLLRQGQRDEAISHFQRALQINPSFAGARANLQTATQSGPKL